MNEESTTTTQTEKKGLWRAHAAPTAAYARVAVCLTRGSWAGRGRKANRGSGKTENIEKSKIPASGIEGSGILEH